MWPQWSADGKTLAFSNTTDNTTWQMYTVPAEGGPPRPLLKQGQDERLPRYSPDGTRVAFQAVRNDVEQVFTCAPDGSDVRQLT
jgi:Tol biopolymer transport system component